MITGCWPEKHGVINNTYDEIDKKPHWKFEHKNVKCNDLLDACKQSGLKTASVGWPVSGNHPSVDYLVNECWPEPSGDIDDYRKAYLKSGTPKWLFDEMVEPILETRVGRKQPESSYFLAKISTDIIQKYKPDILVVHPSVVDSFRHKNGVFNDKIYNALDCCDDILGMLINAAKAAGTFEQTNFVVTADHGHLNATRKINVNCLLAQNGLINISKNGQVKSWDAFCFPMGGMSAYIKLKDSSDKELYNRVYNLLTEKCSEGLWGFSQVFTREECKKMHLDGDFSFVIETDGYTKFGTDWLEPAVVPMPFSITGPVRGDHGFHPDKGPRPPFIACGPEIKKGAILDNAELIDGAPTYAKILGIDLPDADGRALSELLTV
ncbi:MAG: alkaline phosphatase family protein [Clostridia bacterium]|nr:alkaline phosphatase family protein [Clostridia bacterium]